MIFNKCFKDLSVNRTHLIILLSPHSCFIRSLEKYELISHVDSLLGNMENVHTILIMVGKCIGVYHKFYTSL